MNLTPEWVVALIAIATIIFHAGYTWNLLSWLKENAATKADLMLIRAEHTNNVVTVPQCDAKMERVEAEIGQVRVMVATSLAELRAIKHSG